MVRSFGPWYSEPLTGICHTESEPTEWRDWQPVLVLSLTASVNSMILGERIQIQLHRHFLQLERGRILVIN